MKTLGWGLYIVFTKKYSRCAGVFAKNQRDFFEHAQSTEGYILEVSYRGRNNIESSHSLYDTYTIHVTLNLKKPLVYVTRDIERALGMEPAGSYFIVSNDSTYGRDIQKKYPDNVLLIKSKTLLDTYDLLLLPEVQKTIQDHRADIVVFQNTLRIERLAQEKGWYIINPSAELSKKIEEKISQVAWLGDDAILLPPHTITTTKSVSFTGKKLVLQYNHAHTGQGTYIIDKKENLEELQKMFPDRECRVTDFIDGPVFTVNTVVGKEIIVGNPSYQITGLLPFTDLLFSTIGNDWSLPLHKEYTKLRTDIVSITEAVAKKLKASGWKGLFGIDVIFDSKKQKTYLLEINARQPASTTFESQLQKEIEKGAPTLFEQHIAALLGEQSETKVTQVKGSQIVKRITQVPHKVDVSALETKNLRVMRYENDIHNKELFRIQSTTGIMENHNELNVLGEFIRSQIN